MQNENFCACCGVRIPEDRHICIACEIGSNADIVKALEIAFKRKCEKEQQEREGKKQDG